MCPCMSENVFIWYRILGTKLFSLRNLKEITSLTASADTPYLVTRISDSLLMTCLFFLEASRIFYLYILKMPGDMQL